MAVDAMVPEALDSSTTRHPTGHTGPPTSNDAAGAEGTDYMKKTTKSPGLARTNSSASGMEVASGGLEVDSRKARSSASSVERFFFRDEERRRWEDVIVGLSRHPVLENFGDRMGLWQLDRIDYYSMLQTHWSKTFKRTSVLGIPGTKARVMMLFIWSLTSGHSKDQVATFVSEEVNRGMCNYLTNTTMEDIALQLAGPYKGVIEDLAKEFKSDFPPEVAARLNEALPPDWHNRSPKDYEYEAPGLENVDVTDVTSLKPLLVVPDHETTRFFKPVDKESERTLWWFVKMFHLGCLAQSKGDVAKGFHFAVRMPASPVHVAGSEATGSDIAEPTDSGSSAQVTN